MPPTVTWPTSRPSTSTANGSSRPCRASRSQVADQLAERRSGVPPSRRDRRLPRPQPRGVGRPQRLPLTPVAVVQRGAGPGRSQPSRQRRRTSVAGQSSLISGRPRRSARRACASTGSSTASPSLTPPVEPGRLTTRVRPATPASPRDSTAVGTPVRDAVRPDRLGDARAPRGRAAARVTSGVRSVGVRPVPPVVSTTSAPPATAARSAASDRLAVGHDDRVRSTVEAQLAQAVDDQRAGAVVVDPGRGPVGRGRRPRARGRSLDASPRTARRVLASTRTSVITAALVDRLDHVDRARARRPRRAVSASISTPVRSAVRTVARDLDAVVGDLEVDRRPRGSRSGGTAGPGRGCAWRP